MNERERREPQPLQLLPETRRLLADTERLSGRPIEIRPDPAVSSRGRAIYVVSDPDKSRDLVLYDPEYERFLSHLAAHETGHIRHFSQAPEQERTVPVLTEERRIAATRWLLPDLADLLARGIPERALPGMLSLWLSGTVAQLSDTPADIEIERYVWENYPALHAAQRASLTDQVRTLHKVADTRLLAVTPPSIWLASNSLNFALVKSVAGFLKEPWMLRAYRHSQAEMLGEELSDAMATGAAGLAGFRQVTDEWANRLGFRGWYEWRRLDELPKDRPIALE
jgi:hypothetical protein